MKIVEVNFTDLVGRIFNGYDLHLSLKSLGYNAIQVVKDKRSMTDSVIELEHDVILDEQLKNIEKKYSMSNLLYPYGLQLLNQEYFHNADLVHYHILHNNMISILDIPQLMNTKPSVWTLHDPWILTGNCVYPLECQKWKSGCDNCTNLQYKHFEMKNDKTSLMWKIKKDILSQIDIDIIVSSDFMKKQIMDSPIHNFKRIHKIPFGVDTRLYDCIDKKDIRKKLNIGNDKFVIGFRNEESPIKGCDILFQSLSIIENINVVLITTGNAVIPLELKSKYEVIELGWVDDDNVMKEFYKACDIFIMPSLAETFGLMAIEAMAAGTPVICFKETVLEEITQAPECGIAVEYRSSIAIANEIERLKKSENECLERGKKSRQLVLDNYQYKNYVEKHIELYSEIIMRKRDN